MLLAAYSQISRARVHHPIVRPFLGAASVFLVILYIDAAVLSRWTFETKSPTSALGGLDPGIRDPDRNEDANTPTSTKSTSTQPGIFAARLLFGFKIALQSRFPRTVWAAKSMPDFPQAIVPSRASFLIRNVLRCASYILLLRLVNSLGDPSQNPTLFSSTKIPLAGNVIHPRTSPSAYIDLAQLGSRLLGVLGYWTVQYLIINLLYDILATFSVALHITNVDVWPPVFGRHNETWSLRQFWGRFYHQLIRRGCSSIAHLITYPCLKLRKGSLPARYVFMAVVFAVSAIFHLLSDIAIGIPAHESGAVIFFCCQTPAIMFEDAAKALFQQLAGRIGGVTTRKKHKISYSEMSLSERVLIKALGYLWVLIWLTCISPVWIYPAMRRDTGIPLVPF